MSYPANLQAVANEILLTPEGDSIVSGVYPATPVLDKILANGIEYGSGTDAIKIPIQVSKSAATTGSDPYSITLASSTVENLQSLAIDLKAVYFSDVITGHEVRQASNARAVNLLKQKMRNVKEAIKGTLSLNVITGDGSSPAYPGFESFWTGASYGGLTRATYPVVLASNTAYDVDTNHPKYGAGSTMPTQAQTLWDCTGAAISDKTAEEVAASLIMDAKNHISDSGDAPEFLLVSKDVNAQLVTFVNEKGGVSQYGLTKSVTATGGYELLFDGMKVIVDQQMPAQSAMLLNTSYIKFCAPEGETPNKVVPVIDKHGSIFDAQAITGVVWSALACTNSTKLAWLTNIPN